MFLEKYFGNGRGMPYVEKQVSGNSRGIVFIQDSECFPESREITLIGKEDTVLIAPCFIENDNFIIFEQGDCTIIGLVRYGAIYVVSEYFHPNPQATIKRRGGDEWLNYTIWINENKETTYIPLNLETWESMVRDEINNGTYNDCCIEGLRSYRCD